MLTEGIEKHVMQGAPVPVYSVAKTVVDCFRFRHRIGFGNPSQERLTAVFRELCRVEVEVDGVDFDAGSVLTEGGHKGKGVRGDRREAIFGDDSDRNMFLATLEEARGKTAWQAHAYCVITCI